MNMPWVARDHAPWFGRTLDALQRRLPEVAALLDPLVVRTLDAQAWQSLFDTYFKKMYSFAYARTGDPQLAEDIASEVFAGAALFRPDGSEYRRIKVAGATSHARWIPKA